MSQPEWVNETPEEKSARLYREAAKRLQGFMRKASEIPSNRPRPPRRKFSVWERIELRLKFTGQL